MKLFKKYMFLLMFIEKEEGRGIKQILMFIEKVEGRGIEQIEQQERNIIHLLPPAWW